MKYLKICGSALMVALLSLFVAPFVRAQNPIRVARLSRAEGQVLVAHFGSDVWEEAPANLPLREGDTLATQAGLAEIEFENGSTAFLADNSTLQFTQLNFSSAGRTTELTLNQGGGTFYASLTSQDTFRVRASTFDVVIAERAQFRVDAFQDGAAVQVLLGNVSITTAKGSSNLEKGQSMAIHEKDFQDLNIVRLPEEDSFDRWVNEQGELIRSGNENTLSYVSSPNSYGLSDLSIYGTWINFPGLGVSWRPFRVGASWTPYLNGSWTLDPRLGWIWVSNEPWGWVPYHFGSWQLSPILGWIWVPGGSAGLSQWQSARVNWVQVGSQVGWVAMSPNDREGAAANVAQGVVTKSARSPLNGMSPNEIVTGKGLQNVTSIKQPPPELAARSGPGVVGAPHSGVQPITRVPPWTANYNPSIVYDRWTRTFVNRDVGRNEELDEVDNRDGEAVKENNPPSSLIPRSELQTQFPQRKIPSSTQRQPRTDRAPLSPPIPASHTNVPVNRMPPARSTAIAPSTPQRSSLPPASSSRVPAKDQR